MDFGELRCGFFGEYHKYRISVLDTVKPTEPGYSTASWLDGIFITGLYLAV